MSALSPATAIALFRPSASMPSYPTSVPGPSSGGNPLDIVTQRLAEQVADGKLTMEQGTSS